MTKRRPARPGAPGPSEGRFRHLLVPTDLTERTVKALQLAGQLGSSNGARVTLIHVIETIPGLSIEELKPFYERLERKARKAMEALTRRTREDGPAAVQVIVRGRRA